MPDFTTGIQARRPRPRKADAHRNDLLKDDMRWTDMMDGTLMPTIGSSPSAPPSSMSAHTNSIISLPPLEGAAKRWHNLHAVPPRVRRQRGGSLGGRDISRMLANRDRKRSPPFMPAAAAANGRKPDDVRIDIAPSQSPPPPITAPILPPVQTTASRHKRRPSRTLENFDDDADQVTVRDSNSKFVHYGAMGGAGAGASAHAAGHSAREDDEWSTGTSSQNGSIGGRRIMRRKGKKRMPKLPSVDESNWDWRFPGTEDALMPSLAWVYLPLIGALIFVTAVTVNLSESNFRKWVIDPFHQFCKGRWGESSGLFALCAIRSVAILISFAIVYNWSPLHGAGSGIPEMKCVLSGVFMPNVLSAPTLVVKVVGLSLSVASGISVGKLGPFIHMAGIIASLVSEIPLFKALKSNPRFKLQALSAAIAAGVGATFGAPIGGAMLSIELMSSYYFIHWLPMSLFCSIMGYYFVALFIETGEHVYFNPDVVLSLQGHPSYYIFVYSLLGITCGLIGFCLIRFTILMKRTIGHFFKMDKPRKVAILLAAFVTLHTVLTNAVGGVLDMPQKKGVEQLFASAVQESSYEWINSRLQLWPNSWGSSLALFIIMSIKFLLTGISMVLPIPAGTFMPIFQIGAFLGRAFGEFIRGFALFTWVDPRATAIVGAASLTSGTLHVTSIAVVMLELTRDAVNVLPITVSVVVSYAVSKSLSSDLFSEFIKFRRLPYILGLREQIPRETRMFNEDCSSFYAKNFMTKKFAYVTRSTTVGELRQLLSDAWEVVAFFSDDKDKAMYGVIKRHSLETVLSLMDAAENRPDAHRQAHAGEADGSSSGGMSSRRDALRDEPIVFLRDFELKRGHPLVDMGFMQVSMYTPFWKVITYFRMLSMNRIFVMAPGGHVAGVITKPSVVEHCYGIEQEVKAKRRKELDKIREERRGEAEARKKYGGSLRVNRRMAREMSTSNLVAMDGRRSRNASIQL